MKKEDKLKKVIDFIGDYLTDDKSVEKSFDCKGNCNCKGNCKSIRYGNIKKTESGDGYDLDRERELINNPITVKSKRETHIDDLISNGKELLDRVDKVNLEQRYGQLESKLKIIKDEKSAICHNKDKMVNYLADLFALDKPSEYIVLDIIDKHERSKFRDISESNKKFYETVKDNYNLGEVSESNKEFMELLKKSETEEDKKEDKEV